MIVAEYEDEVDVGGSPETGSMSPFIPQVGEIVFYYHGGEPDNQPFPMLVTSVTQNTISGTVFFDTHFKHVSGVRHINDPWVQDHAVIARQEGLFGRKGGSDNPHLRK